MHFEHENTPCSRCSGIQYYSVFPFQLVEHRMETVAIQNTAHGTGACEAVPAHVRGDEHNVNQATTGRVTCNKTKSGTIHRQGDVGSTAHQQLRYALQHAAVLNDGVECQLLFMFQ